MGGKQKDFTAYRDALLNAIRTFSAWSVASKNFNRGYTTSSYSDTILSATPSEENGARIVEIRLYNNLVAKVYCEELKIFDGGWRTSSTATILTQLLDILNFKSRVISRRQDLVVLKPDRSEIAFENGMRFSFQVPLWEKADAPCSHPSAVSTSSSTSTSTCGGGAHPRVATPSIPDGISTTAQPPRKAEPLHVVLLKTEEQAIPSVPILEPATLPLISEPIWLYRDPQGLVQGPFAASQIKLWNEKEMLPPDLEVYAKGHAPRQLSQLLACYNAQQNRDERVWFFEDPRGGLHGAYTLGEIETWLKSLPIHRFGSSPCLRLPTVSGPHQTGPAGTPTAH